MMIIFSPQKKLTQKQSKLLSLGLLIYLFPFYKKGNFFNNWLNMMLYYIIGLYMFFKLQKNIKKYKYLILIQLIITFFNYKF